MKGYSPSTLSYDPVVRQLNTHWTISLIAGCARNVAPAVNAATRNANLAPRLLVTIIFLVVVAGSRSSSAQLGAGVFADANNPSGSPDPLKPGGIWQVDPMTGSLSVNIPLISPLPGGRGSKIPFSLHYNSASTITLQAENTSAYLEGTGSRDITLQCSNAPMVESACELGIATGGSVPSGFGGVVTATETYGWHTGPGFTSQIVAPADPWTSSGPFMTSEFDAIANQVLTIEGQTVTIGSGCWINGPYLYIDEDGATHDMNLKNTFNASTTQPAPVCSNLPTQLTSNTWDGSALQTSTSSSTGANAPIGPFGPAGPFPYVVYPNGTMYLGTMLEDSNGNETVIASGKTVTDSLGRTVYSTNTPLGQPERSHQVLSQPPASMAKPRHTRSVKGAPRLDRSQCRIQLLLKSA